MTFQRHEQRSASWKPTCRSASAPAAARRRSGFEPDFVGWASAPACRVARGSRPSELDCFLVGLAARLGVVFVVPSAISYLHYPGRRATEASAPPFHCLLRYRRRYYRNLIVSPSFIAD